MKAERHEISRTNEAEEIEEKRNDRLSGVVSRSSVGFCSDETNQTLGF